MTLLLLIRHGENEYTRTGKLAGWTPAVHLNEAGQKQAQAMAERLRPAPIAAIYASPLERAIQTAEPLARAKGLKVEICEGLGEVRYGRWTGRSLKMVRRTRLWGVVQRQPSMMEFPEGETLRAVQARAVDAVEQIVRKHPKKMVAAFSHGDVIKLVVAHYLGMPLDLFQRIVISTGSITLLSLGHGQPTLVKLNDTGPMAPQKR
ncbi:MAG: MSMEG_4193 family putative phosphomutase [Anaerolineales bacterium]